MVNYNFWKNLGIEKHISGGRNIKTIGGNSKSEGIASVNVTIGKITKPCNFFIVKSPSFKDNVLLGLDCIKAFRLCQDENLKITQAGSEIKKDTIASNMTGIKINFLNNCDNKCKITKIIKTYDKIFAKTEFDIGSVKNFEATIKLTENKYIAKKPYKCSLQDKIEIESQIKELLKLGVIEESCSPNAAPVTLVQKKDKTSSRMCIDFKGINKYIVPENYPFPRIDDLVVRFRNAKYFTKLDIKWAFWSIPIREKDRYKTAFVTHHGHWQWKRLPFGLKSSPAIFQRCLANIIRKYNLNKSVVNYIDDILIFSETYEEHLKLIELTLNALFENGFKLNWQKCEFAAEEVVFLGHKIGYNTIQPLLDNIIAVKNFPVPKTRTQVRQFLGKINFYISYIPKASIVLDPLHSLLRKNVDFVWSAACQNSFNKIREYLCTEPILAIFDPNGPIIIHTDASIEGVGATLKQPQKDETLKPVFYFSRKLNKSQKLKKAIFLETLAVKEAILYWQYYLIGKEFIVYSDHKPLENLNIKNCNDPQMRELLNYISQFNVKIKYNPGLKNLEADSLSRNPVLAESDTSINEHSAIQIVNFITKQEIIHNQKSLTLDDRCKIDNQIIYKKLNNNWKVWLPEEFGIELIKKLHVIKGHIGVKQINMTVTKTFYFKNMHKHIKLTCRFCETCLKNKSRFGHFKAPLSQLGPAEKPCEIVSLDTIGGFAGYKSTKNYLHLIIDHFTRFAFILTSSTQNAKDFIKLVESIKTGHEIKSLLADQYGGINSSEFKNYLKAKNINLIFTAGDCAFSNGLNERTNQTLVNRLRCKIFENRNRPWSVLAQECVDEYNNSVHSSTGFTPKYLLTGNDEDSNTVGSAKNRDLEKNREMALEKSKKIHKQNKKYYDKFTVRHDYNKGDLVYIQNSNKLSRGKLAPIRMGPYVIKSKISDLIYEVESGLKKRESNLFHASKLIPYHTASTFSFIT